LSRQNVSLLDLNVLAAGAITACRAVGYGGLQATVQGQKVMGAAVTDQIAGQYLPVTAIGTAVMESGAAVAVGDSLIVDATGRAIPTTGALGLLVGATAVTSSAANGAILTGGNPPEYIFADALQAASGAGQFIEVVLRR
jgi:hypothetical protein